ncbi:hypothetical protein F5144DRAFT_620328 [Chaetomium tenue]|uniref:Uncharacterized protein n=1 Tax=Chaetomium tenue TaxID=1854479 RepID=A0ACB7PDM6_9PEZI|nr:hypothetical protein F5144DRAFT_620328 [Chaetomium globosum]
MEPLSITAGAVGLAAHVLRSAAYVKEAVDQFRDAPTLAHDIEHEIKIVQAALRQVEAALQRDPQAINRLSLADIFELSVEGCRDTLQDITQEFEALFGRHDWRLKLAVLETKKGSLMLLVQALSLHSVQEMQELLQQNMRTLDIARLGLDDMVHSYPAYTAKDLDSTASGIDSGNSMLGDRDSVVSNTRFNFDDICFDSKPYRHTVARVAAKNRSHYKRRDADALSSPPLLLATRETEAEAGTTTHEVPTPIHLTGVPPEEHQAVLMKLREAEALIRTLQGRTKQPGTMPRENPAVADPSQHPLRVEDNVHEPLQAMAPQTAEIGSTKQPQVVDDLLRPTTKSRRRSALPVEDTRDFRPVRILVRNKPGITTRLDSKAAGAINEPSAPSDKSPAAAGPTRSPGRPRLTHSRKDIGILTEYLMGTREEKAEPSIKGHFSPRERSSPQHMMITHLHGETTQTLNADTGREVTLASIPDTQVEDRPKATSRAISAATSLGHPRPWLATNGEEERLIPNAISTIPSRSPLEILERRLSHTKAHVMPELDVLKGQRALPKLDIEANARQLTPNVKEEAHEVFQYVVPPARPNPPLLLPTNHSFQGPDASRTNKVQKRAVTVPRPRLGYNPNLHVLDVDRVVNGIMENTAQRVRGSNVPTGNGAQAHPLARGLLEARSAKEEEATKKRSVFIRAFKGITGPGNNNLATIEDILGKLLVEVETLKTEAQQDKGDTVVKGR